MEELKNKLKERFKVLSVEVENAQKEVYKQSAYIKSRKVAEQHYFKCIGGLHELNLILKELEKI